MDQDRIASCQVFFAQGPFGDLWGHLEHTAKEVSDALTGGGVWATYGASVESVLQRAALREERLISALTRMNRVLREIDRRRQPFEREAAQAIEARQRQDAKTGLARKGESAVGKADAPTL